MAIGVQLYSLLTSVFEGSEASLSGSGHFTHGINTGIHHRKDWVGPRSGLDGYKEEKISCQHRVSNPRSSNWQPVATPISPTELSRQLFDMYKRLISVFGS
jgi:hypothetical protein